MTEQSFKDDKRRHWCWPGTLETTILFPVGVGIRRYYVTVKNGRGSTDGWLSCQSWRSGKLHEDWTIPLFEEVAGAPSRPRTLDESGGTGTLAKLLGSLGRKAIVKENPAALGALNAVKPFACYEFDAMSGVLQYGYVPALSTFPNYGVDFPSLPEHHVLQLADSNSKDWPGKDWPRLGRPYPICNAEMEWLRQHRG